MTTVRLVALVRPPAPTRSWNPGPGAATLRRLGVRASPATVPGPARHVPPDISPARSHTPESRHRRHCDRTPRPGLEPRRQFPALRPPATQPQDRLHHRPAVTRRLRRNGAADRPHAAPTALTGWEPSSVVRPPDADGAIRGGAHSSRLLVGAGKPGDGAGEVEGHAVGTAPQRPAGDATPRRASRVDSAVGAKAGRAPATRYPCPSGRRITRAALRPAELHHRRDRVT